jgi:ParB family chromosome partitioning protein
MAKKINEKTAGISLAGFQPRSKGGSIEAPPPAPPALVDRAHQAVAADGIVPSTARVASKSFTGAGIFMSAITGKDDVAKELADVQAKLEEFKGAEIARFLDPNLVQPSKWANRSEASFKSTDFENLKSEIESAGGNVQPIKVRPLIGAVGEFEIVFGHRRHRACLELGLPVLALIEELNDVALFSQMDRENRQRADLRPFEQGVMYARALDEGLFPSLRKMSEALGVDVGNASKAISLARLPALVLSCFSSPLDLQQAWATDLSVALQKDPDIVLGRARKLSQIVAKQSAVSIFKELIGKGVVSNNTPNPEPLQIKGPSGRTGKIGFNSKKESFEISLTGFDWTQMAAIEAAIRKILA